MRKLIISFILMVTVAAAQTAITSITTTTTSVGATTIGGTTFDGLNRAVISMSDAAGNIYTPSAMGTDVFVRRNTAVGNSNNTSVTFASSPSGFSSTYATTLQNLLLSNNIYRSSDNLFNNGTAADAGNIERVDFLFNGTIGIQANASLSVVMFERGLANAHDGFNITLITGWDSVTNTPTSFTRITTVSTSDYGSSNVTVDGVANYNYNYNLFRYNNGDNLASWNTNSQTGSQGIGAVLLDFFGLGAKNGQTIYGYSIAANDSTTRRGKFDEWSNTNYFPENSTNGLDPYGINGFTWEKNRPIVPEPSTYGAIFVGVCLAGVLYKRRISKV
jgi:hypothetical protein